MSTIGKLRVRLQVDVTTNKANEMVWASANVDFHAVSLERGFCLGQEEEDHDVGEGQAIKISFQSREMPSRAFPATACEALLV